MDISNERIVNALKERIVDFFKEVGSFNEIDKKLDECIYKFFNNNPAQVQTFTIGGFRHGGIDYTTGKKVRIYQLMRKEIFIYYNAEKDLIILDF